MAEGSGYVNETNGVESLTHTESSGALMENDISVCIEDQSNGTSASNHNGSTELSQFYASKKSDDLHVGRPKSSPHFIGYHPIKLYKIKERLHCSDSIAFLPGNRLIATDEKGHIEIFDNEGKFERTIVKAGKPCGIATNRSGMFAFVDLKNKEKAIKVYTEDGGLVSEFGMKNNWKPHGIAVTNKGLLIVTDTSPKTPEYVIMFTNAGKVMCKFGNIGIEKSQLTEPLYVFVDAKDRILISDKTLSCVKVYSERGEFLGKFGTRGSGDGQFLTPRGLTEDAFGNILVCDTANKRVSAFSHNGYFIKHILTTTDGVTFPVDIAYEKQSGRLAVSMRGANGKFHKIRIYQIPSLDEALKR